MRCLTYQLTSRHSIINKGHSILYPYYVIYTLHFSYCTGEVGVQVSSPPQAACPFVCCCMMAIGVAAYGSNTYSHHATTHKNLCELP